MREISYEILRRSDGAIAVSFNFGEIIPSPDSCLLTDTGLQITSTKPLKVRAGITETLVLADLPQDVRSYVLEYGGIKVLEFSRSGLERETIAYLSGDC